MELWCLTCHAPAYHQLRPWQTERGIFGAVSCLCTVCGEVTILNLKDGWKLVIPDDNETKV